MSSYDFNEPTVCASSLLELELGEAHTPTLDDYWMHPLIRLVISGSQQIDKLPHRPSSVASRDSHFIGV